MIVQGQATQFIWPNEPFAYLEVQLNMNLNWKHQHAHVRILQRKHGGLKHITCFIQIHDVIHKVNIPGMAYFFPVTPCMTL
jgi:hypothetical protein